MPSVITRITEEQEAQIPHYIQKWVSIASGEVNIAVADKAVEDMYADMGLSKPKILHFDSPMSCHLALAMLKGSQLDSQLGSQLRSQLGSQLWSQLRSQLGSQLDSQLDSQLWSQLGSQLRSQLGSQLDSQLDSQLWSQLRSQLWSQLRSQLDSQLGSQLRSQLGSQLWSQLRSQLGSQLWSQLGSQLDSQLGSQLRSQLGSQLRSQLDSQLWSQLRSQLWSQLRSQLDSQLWSQLGSQLWSQLRSQLGSQLDSQLWSQLGSQLDSQLGSQLVTIWWTAWTGFYDYAESIGVVFNHHKLDLFKRFTSNIGFCLPFHDICIYSLKPTEIHWDNGRLHNPNGKAVKYADGWGWYALNGIPMAEWQVMTPTEELSLEKILSVEDIDQRRELVRRVGIERLASEGKELDKLGFYKLLDMRAVYQRQTPTLFLLMKNPSVANTWHCEGVGSECKTVIDALNWRKPAAMKQIPVSEEGQDWYQQGDVCIWPADALMLKELPCVLT